MQPNIRAVIRLTLAFTGNTVQHYGPTGTSMSLNAPRGLMRGGVPLHFTRASGLESGESHSYIHYHVPLNLLLSRVIGYTLNICRMNEWQKI